MPIFDYEAIDNNGKTKKGSLEASDIDAVRANLKTSGLIPVSVAEQSMLNKDLEFSIGKRVKAKDLAIFCKQFTSILNAGVTAINALEMLYEQTENKYMAEAIKTVQLGVEKGESLAGAMSAVPKVFPEILINMVNAGEASGSLDVAFERMATHFEKSNKLQSTVKKAMIYPIAVLVVATLVIIFLLVKVIPTFEAMFNDLDTELPAITKGVVAASKVIQQKWYIFAFVIAVIATLFHFYKKSDTGSMQLSKMGLKAPLFGKLIRKSASATLTRTLSTLLAAGISLIDAVDITAKVMTNKVLKEVLYEVKDEVEKGVALSEPLQASGEFPPMVYHMIHIGEETGNMETMLDKIADYYEDEVANYTQAMMTIMEPIIIILLAIIVGVILVAVLMPMMSLYQSIGA